MPKYKVVISKTAQKQLDKFSEHIANPILNTISSLANNPNHLVL
jgi:mRNA-degrading endonuclease RelE of RelBE toxin-antitoxin system